MLQFKSLTNVRPSKDLGNQVVLAPTEGQIKITPDAVKVLGLSAGDYVQIVEAGGNFYITLGDEAEGIGAKVASSNKGGGGTFTCSIAAAWQEMKGSTEHNSHFDLISDEESVIEQEGKTYFPLSFVEQVAKQVRKKKNADGSDSEETEDVDFEEDDADDVAPTSASFEEM